MLCYTGGWRPVSSPSVDWWTRAWCPELFSYNFFDCLCSTANFPRASVSFKCSPIFSGEGVETKEVLRHLIPGRRERERYVDVVRRCTVLIWLVGTQIVCGWCLVLPITPFLRRIFSTSHRVNRFHLSFLFPSLILYPSQISWNWNLSLTASHSVSW